MPSWAAFPGLAPAQILFLEAFGHLSRDTNLPGVVSDEEDLYSVFRARADLLSWSSTPGHSSSPRFAKRPLRPLLWQMNEAELTAGIDASRIGWVQVGLEADVDAAMALPALIQCFDDALRRFGAVELSGLQVTASYLQPSSGSCAGDLMSGRNWFNTTLKARADALIVFDNELLGGRTEAEVVASLQRLNTGSFEFGPVVAVPQEDSIKVPVETPNARIPSSGHSGLGVSVTLPEWTASAAAWVLAIVVDEMRFNRPDVRDFAVRVARVR